MKRAKLFGKTVPLAVILASVLLIGLTSAFAPSSYTFAFLTPNGYVPRFSPDGKWITYAMKGDSAYQVVVERIGDPSTLTIVDNGAYLEGGACKPVWLQDGKTIYFVDLKGTVLVAREIRIKGDNVIVGPQYIVYDPPEEELPPEAKPLGWYAVSNFDVSPNGKFIVFWSLLTDTPGVNWRGDPRVYSDLFLVPRSPDGTFRHEDRIQLTTSPIGDYEPRISPNGKEIVYVSYGYVQEGSKIVYVWPHVNKLRIDAHGNPVGEPIMLQDDATWPFWSPNGRYVGVTKRLRKVYGKVPGDIWVIDAETGDFLWDVTTDGETTGKRRWNYAGDWSPTDWASIVFRKHGWDWDGAKWVFNPEVEGLYYAEAQH